MAYSEIGEMESDFTYPENPEIYKRKRGQAE